jgi:hypothetical protein
MLFQAKACKRLGSPLYGDLLQRVATDLEEEGPSWEILRGHEHDPGGSALALRLMGAVNRLVLAGEEPALDRIYHDPERDEAAAWQEFRSVLERNPDRLRRLVEHPVQTNEVGRCAALLPGFLTVAAETGLPLRLLEVGASAGLNLYWDRYRYVSDRASWGPPDSPLVLPFELEGDGAFPEVNWVDIAERRGCDTVPIDPTGTDGPVDLLAYIWPDQPDRIERVRAALEIASERRVEVEHVSAAVWVERMLREATPNRVTVLFHSIVEQYLSEEELASFHRSVREAGQRATPAVPLAWLRMEPDGDRAGVWLTLWPGGEDRLLARASYHGTPVELRA